MTTKNTACELREALERAKFMLDNTILRFILTQTMLCDLRKQFTDVEVRSAVLGISGALELVLIQLEELLGEDAAADEKEETDTFDDEDQDDETVEDLIENLLKTLL